MALGHGVRSSGTAPSATGVKIPSLTLSFGDEYDVVVSHIEPDGTVFVQLVKWASAFSNLMQRLHAEMGGMTRPSPPPPKGLYCAAKSAVDGIWYRGVVVDSLSTGTVVRYIDFGNEEQLQSSQVQPLKPYFTKLPAQGIPCAVNGLTSALTNGVGERMLIESFSEIVDVAFKIVVCGNASGEESAPTPVNFIYAEHPSSDLLDKLKNRCLASGVQITAASPPPSVASPFRPLELSSDRTHVVDVVFVRDPSEFYCQVVEKASVLSELMDFLQMAFSQSRLLPLHHWPPRVHEPIAAQYSEDDAWYRAVVTRHVGDRVEVRFVDYGNEELVGEERCARLPPPMLRYEAMAIRCLLDGVAPAPGSVGGSWSPAATEYLESLSQFTLTARCKGRATNDAAIVELFITTANRMQRNVVDEMVTQRLAVRSGCREIGHLSDDRMSKRSPSGSSTTSFGAHSVSGVPRAITSSAAAAWSSTPHLPSLTIRPGQRSEVMFSWTTDPSEFYVQLVEQESVIGQLSDRLDATYEPMPPRERRLQRSTPGSLCAAKFSDDGRWYRAAIRETDGREARIYFIDFGNAETKSVDSLKELHPDLARFPAMAIKCGFKSLAPYDSAVGWRNNAGEFLENLVGEDTLDCSFVSLGAGGTWDVVLRCDRIGDLSEELKKAKIAVAVAETNFGMPDVKIGSKTGWPASQNQPSSRGSSTSSDHRSPPALPTIASEPLSADSKELIVVSHVDNLANFWVQRVSGLAELDETMAAIEAFYSDPLHDRETVVSRMVNGTHCVAKYSEDDQWYRAVITKTYSPQQVEVHYIDYGNRENLSLDKVRSLRSQFARLSAQAHLCALHGLPSAPNLKDKLSQLTDELELWLRVISAKDGKSQIILNSSESPPDDSDSVNAKISSFLPTPSGRPTPGTAPPPSTATEPSIPDLPTFRPPVIPPVSFRPFPARPLLSKQLRVYVTFAVDPGEFYVQSTADMDAIDAMMGQLEAKAALERPLAIQGLTEGLPVCAKYSVDDKWYRARVEKVDAASSKVDIFFVDFGNREPLQAGGQDVKPLPGVFVNDAPHALRCRLTADDVHWTESQVSSFSDLLLDCEFNAEFLNPEPPYLVVLKDDDGQIVGEEYVRTESNKSIKQNDIKAQIDEKKDDKIENQISSKSPSPQLLLDPSTPFPYPRIHIPPFGDSEGEVLHEAFVSHIDGVEDFYLQLSEFDVPLEELMDEVEEASKSAPDLTAPAKGDPCLAVYSVDGSWYRAVVLDLKDDQIKVQFVDYGNRDWIPLGDGKIKSLSDHPDLVSTNAFAIPATLHGIKRPLRASLKDLFRETIDDHVGLKARFHPSGELPGRVRLYINGQDISPILTSGADSSIIRETLATSKEESDLLTNSSSTFDIKTTTTTTADEVNLESSRESTSGEPSSSRLVQATPPFPLRESFCVGETLDAIVSHAESPASFWLQLPEHEELLESLANAISDVYESSSPPPPLQQPVEMGTFCCAKFTDDCVWYRAVVIAGSVDLEKLRVRFVDFGNEDELAPDFVRQLTPEIAEISPLLAYKCSILPSSASPPSKDKSCKFVEAVTDESVSAEVLEINIGNETTLVRLSMDGKLFTPEDYLDEKEALAPTIEGLVNTLSNTSILDPLTEISTTASAPFAESSPPLSALFHSASPTDLVLRSPAIPSHPFPAFVSHFSSIDSFFVQPVDGIDRLADFADDLDGHYNAAEDAVVDFPKVGDVVVARWNEDGRWYRAMVEEAQEEIFKVLFVDYGNSELVPASDLRRLDARFSIMPISAFACRLWKPNGVAWISGADDIADDKTTNVEVMVQFCGESKLSEETFREVIISIDGEDLSAALVETIISASPIESSLKIGEPTRTAEKNTETITEVESPEITPKTLMKTSEDPEIISALKEAEILTPSKVESKEPEVTEDMKKSEIVTAADFSEEVVESSDETETMEKVVEQIGEERLSTVRSNFTNDPFIPAPKPTPTVKTKVVISHMEDIRQLWFHLCQNAAKLMSLASVIEEIYSGCDGPSDSGSISSPAIGDGCVVRDDDELWYRAKVLSINADEARVRLVDYGRETTIPHSSVRCLSSKLPNDPIHALGPLSLVPIDAPVNCDAVSKLKNIVEDRTRFHLEFCSVGDHIRLTSLDTGRDIVEEFELASASPPCHREKGAAAEVDQVEELVQKIGKMATNASSGRASPSSCEEETSTSFDDDEEEEGGKWETIGEFVEVLKDEEDDSKNKLEELSEKASQKQDQSVEIAEKVSEDVIFVSDDESN